ncbi:hypothetical protein JHK85_001286 [Glycine max]|nr:hypothetical protein JHK85_001286 [Glycine max]KAG5088636.1 hypothetical protein JHK86_001248 [Glycine max]
MSGADPKVAITIPKRCNLANRPIGYKCGHYTESKEKFGHEGTKAGGYNCDYKTMFVCPCNNLINNG